MKINCEWPYVAEVDFDYPNKFHDKHNNFPLAPESLCPEEWSDYMKSLGPLNFMGEPKYSTVPKLVPNLSNKKNYVVHQRALATYLWLGLKLNNVHRVL